MNNWSATQKGLVTGTAMVIMSFLIYAVKGGFDNALQYVTYSLYVAGIIWTLLSFHRRPDNPGTFGGYFFQGFRCFIVVVLMMVLFTAGFIWQHPELKDQMAVNVREQLTAAGNKTAPEIDAQVAIARNNFTTAMIMAVIFSYLVIGAMITAVTGGVLLQRRQQAG